MTRDGWSFSELGAFFRNYINILGSIAGTDTKSAQMSLVPGVLIDCIPNNLIRRSDGSFEFIDTEWSVAGNIQVRQILFRSLLGLIFIPSDYARDCDGKIYTYQEFFLNTYHQLGMKLELNDLVTMLSEELNFQDKVLGCKQDLAQTETFLAQQMPNNNYLQALGRAVEKIRELDHLAGSYRRELTQIKSSKKWRFANGISRLIPGFLKTMIRSILN